MPFCTSHAPADWSKDTPEVARERKGYWLTGIATGPDTVMGFFFGSALLVIAAGDAKCYEFNGVSSGADGQACSHVALAEDEGRPIWNDTFFREVGGEACLGSNLFGDPVFVHENGDPACAAAFAAFRAAPHLTGGEVFTCNCSGPYSDHAYLGGAGGLRPSGLFQLMLLIGFLVVAFTSPLVGVYSDFSNKMKRNWLRISILGGLFNLGMTALATGGVWVVGMVFGIFTHIFTEIQLPIRAAFLEYVAKDDATRGYVGGLRQAASYISQLIFGGIVIFVFQGTFGVQTWSMLNAGVCGVWFLVSMPLILTYFSEHEARKTLPEGATMLGVTFGGVRRSFTRICTDFPEAGKFLAASTFANFGGPTFITIITAYLPSQLSITNSLIGYPAMCVLAVGLPASIVLAKLMQYGVLNKKVAWVVVLALNLIIGSLIPLVAREPCKEESFTCPSYIMLLLIAGVLGAVAISWFYALQWVTFISFIPSDEVATFAGLLSFFNNAIQPFGNLIYFSIVQGTNSHPLAFLLTTVPFNIIALLLLLSVDFKRAMEQCGRAAPVDIELTATKTSAAVA